MIIKYFFPNSPFVKGWMRSRRGIFGRNGLSEERIERSDGVFLVIRNLRKTEIFSIFSKLLSNLLFQKVI